MTTKSAVKSAAMAKISADGVVRTQKTPDLSSSPRELSRGAFHFFFNRILCEKNETLAGL
jgi:hypothetical protein